MDRHLLLVDFCWTRDKDPRVPLGHASLLAALRQRTRVDVQPVVVSMNGPHLDARMVADGLLDSVGGLSQEQVDIAMGAYVWAEDFLREVLAQLRRRGFGGRIILGGPQVSYSGPGIEALYPDVDVFVRGYGEDALCTLVESPERRAIPGVHYAGEADLCGQAGLDPAALPSPWLTGIVPVQGQRFVRWETQRGCPYQCSFCQHREAGARLRRRDFAVDRLFAEVDLFCRSGVQEIAVLDPIFNVGPKAHRILERFVANGFRGRLALQCRAECTDERFLDAAAALDVGLEFGLQTIHARESEAIRRQNQMDKVDRVLADVRRRGIAHEVSIIFGLPEQTLESFEATIAWCLARHVPVLKAFPLMLLRGTEVDRQRARWGLVESGGAMPMVVESATFSRADWEQMARLAEALKVTEGRHPTQIADLRRIAQDVAADEARWRPVRKAA